MYIIILSYFRKSLDDINILMVDPEATWN